MVLELSVLQPVPFHETIVPPSPTALQSVAVGQLTAKRTLPVPELSGRLQLVPFQERIVPASPTPLVPS